MPPNIIGQNPDGSYIVDTGNGQQMSMAQSAMPDQLLQQAATNQAAQASPDRQAIDSFVAKEPPWSDAQQQDQKPDATITAMRQLVGLEPGAGIGSVKQVLGLPSTADFMSGAQHLMGITPKPQEQQQAQSAIKSPAAEFPPGVGGLDSVLRQPQAQTPNALQPRAGSKIAGGAPASPNLMSAENQVERERLEGAELERAYNEKLAGGNAAILGASNKNQEDLIQQQLAASNETQGFVRDHAAKMSSLADSIANAKIDTNPIYGHMNMGQKIEALVGNMAGGFIGGFTGKGNSFAEHMDQMADRSIKAQVQELENKKTAASLENNIVDMYLRAGADRRTAIEGARAAYSSLADSKMKEYLNQLGGQNASVQAKNAYAEIHQKKIDDITKLQTAAADNGMKKAEAVRSYAETKKTNLETQQMGQAQNVLGALGQAQNGAASPLQREMVRKTYGLDQPQGVPEAQGQWIRAEDADALSKERAQYETIQDLMNQGMAIRARQNTPLGLRVGSDAGQLSAIQEHLAKLAAGGQLTQRNAPYAEKLGGLLNAIGPGVDAELKQIQANHKIEWFNTLKSAGIRPPAQITEKKPTNG